MASSPPRKVAKLDENHSSPSSTRKEEDEFDDTQLPDDLKEIDFSRRISWNKFAPYSDKALPFVPKNTPPVFTKESANLCFQVHAICGRARCASMSFPGEGPRIRTPRFQPVGTKGTLKGVLPSEISHLNIPIILANTYHLAIQPGTELIERRNHLQEFSGYRKQFHLLTDSGGFQMVSLSALSEVTEQGVQFQNPYNNEETLLLKPEDSMRHQMAIGADICMALDDVVSSVTVDDARFQQATYRTLRWYDRCVAEFSSKQTKQNLFPIVQGALDTSVGGLREQCLAGFMVRDTRSSSTGRIPGFAIGGLAGGESKDDFWKVVDQCCKALPDDRPRYLMGVGYPLDLVVCTALGVDTYDCVYPTRTARFGVALVNNQVGGVLKLNKALIDKEDAVLQDDCPCPSCSRNMSRRRLQQLFKAQNTVAIQLLTQHNLAYMMKLCTDMQEAICNQTFPDFVRTFLSQYYAIPSDIPQWVKDALTEAGIALEVGDSD